MSNEAGAGADHGTTERRKRNSSQGELGGGTMTTDPALKVMERCRRLLIGLTMPGDIERAMAFLVSRFGDGRPDSTRPA